MKRRLSESGPSIPCVNFDRIGLPERVAILENHFAPQRPDLERDAGLSTRRFDRRVDLWAFVILHAAGKAQLLELILGA
jgi:hypothetical protein